MPRTLLTKLLALLATPLAKLALALSVLVSTSAQAAFWLVPAGAQAPNSVAVALGRAGVRGDLVAVMAGLNGAFPIRNKPRMVDLETGLVRLLDASALQGVTVEYRGQLRTLAELLLLPGVVIVLDVEANAGPTLQTLANDGTAVSELLEPDERALLGELPCAEGYAPLSMPSGMRCEDVDECAAGLDDCDAHAECDNTAGGFMCSCDDGYEGDGRDCDETPSSGEDDEPGAGGAGDRSDAGAANDGGLAGSGADVGDDAGSPVSDAGPRGPIDAGAGKDDGGGCDCHVTGFEPTNLLNPLLLPLAWLLYRRRRAPNA